MWPWEHLAVGYVLFSLAYRRYTGTPPSDAAAIAVIVGTQFPDLVDKPLAWSFDVVTSGISVAHSVFVATGLSVVAILLAHRYGRSAVGLGFSVGYLAHLPADALYPVILNGELNLPAYLWPLYVAEAGGTRGGFLENFAYYLLQFVGFLGTPRGMTFLAFEVMLLGLAGWLWLSDGCPGLRLPRRRADGA